MDPRCDGEEADSGGEETGSDGEDPTTRREFEASIERLVRAAVANDVRVSGATALRHPAPDSPEWGIEITPLRKQQASESDGDRPETDEQ